MTLDEAEQSNNATEYTVSELSGALKRTVEQGFDYVRVRAELSGVKRAASGHVYMALKDDSAVLDGVMWRGSASKLNFVPEDGLEVVCSGKLTTYPARSKYQMVIDRMEPAGEGALMALLEKRKAALAAEGLFAAERKQTIPFLPNVIGVITSPTGAVIRDILHRLEDRFPRTVIVWPVLVQGDAAKDQIADAINGFNALEENSPMPKPDLLIVARGGGSVEDLWAFNEEVVIRAAADSQIPLISAVGHETDNSLLDLVADMRAPTPTAAAELAVPVRRDLQFTISDLEQRLDRQALAMVSQRSDNLRLLSRALPTPKDILGLAMQKMDELTARLPRGLSQALSAKEASFGRLSGKLSHQTVQQKLAHSQQSFNVVGARLKGVSSRMMKPYSDSLSATTRMLESLSFERILDRGFALVSSPNGKAVTQRAGLQQGDGLTITFRDGAIGAKVDSGSDPTRLTQPSNKAPKIKSKQKEKTLLNDPQGTLF